MDTAIIFSEIQGRNGNIGLIMLNRQQALNALNHAMFIDLDNQLAKWEQATDIKAIIIRAAPGRAFCAGGDIRSAYDRGKANDAELPLFFRDEYRMNKRIFHYPKPYIALLDGITMGGGVGISIHGSHRVATENLLFSMPETGIGFFPDVGATYFLPRLLYNAGIYLGLTGARLRAADCMDLGLTNYFVKHDLLEKLPAAIAEADFGVDAKQAVSKAISTFSSMPGAAECSKHKNEIETCFSRKSVEEILRTLEQGNEWCQQTAMLMQKKSPTSLKVTLRALQTGHELDFDACMEMEYGLTRHFLQGHDFYEGVRAAIIDKDQSPRWRPELLADVTPQDVAKYFESLTLSG